MNNSLITDNSNIDLDTKKGIQKSNKWSNFNNLSIDKSVEDINDDNKWIDYLKMRLDNSNLSEKEIAYINRIIRVHNMPDLSSLEWHPIKMVIDKIVESEFFDWFNHVKVPEVVGEFETFDLFNFPEDHVARRPSDSYFINKSDDRKNSMLLRPHTSVMWYHYLLKQWWKEKLENEGEIKALSWWKVYRVDELDKTHHECFHQVDGLRLVEKEKEIINQDTLKEVLWVTIESIFWENVEYKFHKDSFPYTTDSLEAYVKFNDKWVEVLWAWIVEPTVLEKLWIDSDKYNWWAFGFWIERLAIPLKQVPDIRLFWSEDPRVTSQWWDLQPFKEVSNFPPVNKDISLLVPKNNFELDLEDQEKTWEIELTKNTEANFFAITWVIRDTCDDLIEEVKIIDTYENNKKFWENMKSITIRIVFRSLERTLTDKEINIHYFNIRKKIENQLLYELR